MNTPRRSQRLQAVESCSRDNFVDIVVGSLPNSPLMMEIGMNHAIEDTWLNIIVEGY